MLALADPGSYIARKPQPRASPIILQTLCFVFTQFLLLTLRYVYFGAAHIPGFAIEGLEILEDNLETTASIVQAVNVSAPDIVCSARFKKNLCIAGPLMPVRQGDCRHSKNTNNCNSNSNHNPGNQQQLFSSNTWLRLCENLPSELQQLSVPLFEYFHQVLISEY